MGLAKLVQVLATLTVCAAMLGPLASCKTVAGTVAGSQVAAQAVPPAAAAEPAREADAFVDSVGVATHLAYDNTPYFTRWPLVFAKLKALGVRHIRDGFYNWPSSSPFLAEHQALAAAGIRCTYVIPLEATTTSQIIQAFASRARDLEAVEGPNECDAGDNCGGGGDRGVRNVVSFMPTVFAAGQALHVPVVGPSFTIASSFVTAGNLASRMTHNNLHVYFGGRHPGSTGWGDSDPEGHAYGSLAWWMDQGNRSGPNLPSVITESGYIVKPAPTPYTVSPEVGGAYTPRALLLAFNHGIRRTFLYELLDEFTSDNYGILRGDLSEKPAYTAVKNLLAALSDPGPAFAPGRLSYTLSTTDPALSHTLLQKRDGSFWLVLWLEQSSYDPATNQPVPVAPRDVVLQLREGAAARQLITFNSDGSTTAARVNGASLPLKITERLSIVQIAK